MSHSNNLYSSSKTTRYQPPVKTSVRQLQQPRAAPPSPAHQAYAGTAAPTSSSFEQRMRELVAPTKPQRGAVPMKRPANLMDVSTLQEYKEAVVGNPKIVVVRFHASYCRACRAVAPHFYRLASRYPNIQFLDVAVTERNAALHQGLGVVKLPTVHVYHPEAGLVQDQRLTRPHVPELQATLQNYLQGFCAVQYNHTQQGLAVPA